MSTETDHVLPLSHIFVGPEKTVIISASTLFTYDSQSGEQLASATATSAEKNTSSVIRVAAVDRGYRHIVTSGDDKRLRMWSVEELKELSCREIPKRANVIKLSRDGEVILAADKFGDIFSYPVNPPEPKPKPNPAPVPQPTESTEPAKPTPSAPTAQNSKLLAVAMHDNPEGTPVLGHASIITAFILTPDEGLIVSADRDEHVRVSWYPDGWDVERYCMGHKKFISALEIPTYAPSILISGGGDPELRMWDYRSGRQVGSLGVWEHVRPTLKVRGGRKTWKENKEGKPPRPKKGKGKGKGKGAAVIDEDKQMAEVGDAPEAGTGVEGAESTEGQVAGTVYEEEVFVVSHIRCATFGGEDVVLFSAVGSSALFYFKWPSSLDFTSVIVKSFDLLNPVIDFVVLESGVVWASVDSTWSTNAGAVVGLSVTDRRRIRQLLWKDGALVEADMQSQLAQSLNEGCIVKGSNADIQSLNLHEPLIGLPKITELDDADREASSTPIPADITSGPGLRASARQKAKEQLEKRKALTQDVEQRAAKQPRVDTE
ncbi:hypothetical protein BDV93DRAFT_604984 [Ceratobasidium sp. AG-I]|nr:hypothetical protein BDV93DRAFT_604984 [Ceratobasidium sp. AG-I]